MVTAILQLSQNIQADQSQVSHIVAIVEELIVHETEAIAFEDKVESRRIARFEYDE